MVACDASGPVELHGMLGMVSVTYAVNTDAERCGYHVLGLPYDINVARGFPVMEASVDYQGEGYLAYMGWIQVVQYTYGSDPPVVIIDRAPQILDVDTPFVCWGIRPTFFDAPSTPEVDARWRADDFLVVSPDAVMSKTLKPIYSFCWGYDSDADGVVTPRPCERQPLDAWHTISPFIADRHPAWRLLDP